MTIIITMMIIIIILAIKTTTVMTTNDTNSNNLNSPGLGPMGVSDLQYTPGRCLFVSRPRKVGCTGPTAAKVGHKRSPWIQANHRQGHPDCICAMDYFDAFPIDPENEAIRAVDRPRFCKPLFEKVVNLTTYCLSMFGPHRGGHGAL